MNVLKKDIFSKSGAKGMKKRSDFSSFQTVSTIKPFIPLHTHEEAKTSYSQPSGSCATAQSSQSSSSYNSPENPSGKLQKSEDFENYMQPFLEISRHDASCSEEYAVEGHSISSEKENGSFFKKPRLLDSEKIDNSDPNDSVLLALNQSTSPTSKQSYLSNLTFRAPQNQENDISYQDEVEVSTQREQPDCSTNILTDRMSPMSSIRANTFSTSSDKKSPRTGKTPKSPKTSSTPRGGPSDSDVECCIIAVTEGRGHASGEVGIAAMDPRRPHLILCQISDSQRYTLSLSKMNVFNFTEVVVPNTFIEGAAPRKLYLDILERFPAVTVNHVQRRHFSEISGIQMIQQYCSRESESVMVVIKDKFYALAAVAALLKFIEFTQRVLIAPRSLKVEYQGTDGTVIIDLDTANRLELVLGLISREEAHSLYGVLKHCRTKGGLRLLRANLLQPLADPAKINSRLDCVTELIDNPILFNALESVISQMKNAESLLSLCMYPPQQTGLKAAQFQLKYTLLLKQTLELVPSLAGTLQDANSEYFVAVRENLGDARLASVLKRVLLTIVDSTPAGRTGAFSQLHACFMIRAGINGLLDIAKKTYTELAQEIADLVTALKEKFNLPLRLDFSQSKGYHIKISPLDGVEVDSLPAELILIQKSRSSVTCYTTELVALDQRCQQALHEIQLMTNVLLFELLNDIREEVSCLFPLCECLAELDVCIAFAHVGAADGYVRPVFGDFLSLEDSRHPVLDATVKERVVANHVFADTHNNFVILTGPNQSGKSIYIRQIALLHVMAQVGCYIPAKEASIRIADRIFSRIGFDDSIEGNASTLMVEMQDMEFISNNLTSSSLVIIDELCRGTSVDEGTCLAFVLCEELLDTSAFVFFTTHFIFLTKLQEMYYNVRNFFFETKLAVEGNPSLRFTHRMFEGVTPAEQYGLRLAELMGHPDSVLEPARKAAQLLILERKPQPEVLGLTARYNISKQLRMNLPQESTDWSQVSPVIQRYKRQYEQLPEESPQLVAMLIKRRDPKERVEVQTPPKTATSISEEMLKETSKHEDQADLTKNQSVLDESVNNGDSELEVNCQENIAGSQETAADGPSLQLEDPSTPGHQLASECQVASQDANDCSERTREAAMLLLNLNPTLGGTAVLPENIPDKTPVALQRKTRKRLHRTSKDEVVHKQKMLKEELKKPSVDECLRGMIAGLPEVSDRSPYYQWKYSKDKTAFQTIAVANRAPPSTAMPSTSDDSQNT